MPLPLPGTGRVCGDIGRVLRLLRLDDHNKVPVSRLCCPQIAMVFRSVVLVEYLDPAHALPHMMIGNDIRDRPKSVHRDERQQTVDSLERKVERTVDRMAKPHLREYHGSGLAYVAGSALVATAAAGPIAGLVATQTSVVVCHARFEAHRRLLIKSLKSEDLLQLVANKML